MFSGIPTGHEGAVPVRRWTAVVSFTLQAALVSVAMAYPLLHPESLPSTLHPLFLPLSASVASVESEQTISHAGGPGVATRPIVVNRHRLFFGPSSQQSTGAGDAEAPNIGLLGMADSNGVWNAISADYVRPAPTVAVQPRSVRRSVMMEGNLIQRVEPQYPAIAKQLGIQGSVVVKAWISREGVIQRAQVERGQALLAKAALEAVQQWRYRPYYLNNEPIEVETEITVNFVLQR